MNRRDVPYGISAPASAHARARPGDRLVPVTPSRASSGANPCRQAAAVVVAAAGFDAAQQGTDRLGTPGHQPRGLVGISVVGVGAAGAGRGVGAGPVHHPNHRGQPDLGGRTLRGAFDRLQDSPATVLAVVLNESGRGVHQSAGLLRSQLGDPVRQDGQRLLTVEPLFPRQEQRGRRAGGRRPGGPTRALHSCSLIST